MKKNCFSNLTSSKISITISDTTLGATLMTFTCSVPGAFFDLSQKMKPTKGSETRNKNWARKMDVGKQDKSGQILKTTGQIIHIEEQMLQRKIQADAAHLSKTTMFCIQESLL